MFTKYLFPLLFNLKKDLKESMTDEKWQTIFYISIVIVIFTNLKTVYNNNYLKIFYFKHLSIMRSSHKLQIKIIKSKQKEFFLKLEL